MSTHIGDLVRPLCPHHECTCSIKFSDFYLLEGRNYARLSEFSEFSKCDNDVITCRDVRNFEWKPQLVGGCQKLPQYAKLISGNRPVSSINSEHTNKYIHTYIHIYIQPCVLIVRALRSRSLRDGSLSHKGSFATFVRSC